MGIYEFKSVVPLMYDNFRRVNVDKSVISETLTSVQFEVLSNLLVLVMETGFTNKASKLYMQYPEFTQEDVATTLGLFSPSTAKGRIRYDSSKLSDSLGKDVLNIILTVQDETQLSNINSHVLNLLSKYPRLDLFSTNLLAVRLPDTVKPKKMSLTDTEFNEMKELVKLLGVNHLNTVLTSVGLNIQYVKYLLDGDPIDEIDIKRRKELITVLE